MDWREDFKKAFRRIYGYEASKSYKEEMLYLAGQTDATNQILKEMEQSGKRKRKVRK